MPNPTTSFTARRINLTTFVIIEDDKYGENPYIYAKVHPATPVLVLSDTGCDAPRNGAAQLTHLRTFLEEYPVKDNNNNKPINPAGPQQRSYMIICTHCHYDHILGIEQFKNTPIIASSAGKSFIENDLPEHSLCKWLELRTPQYSITHWMDDYQKLNWTPPSSKRGIQTHNDEDNDNGAIDLDITILQTPGHTPDSLSWYDCTEQCLFVGDTFYELGEAGVPIIFPKEGNWVAYMQSLHELLDFTRKQNAAIASSTDSAHSQQELHDENDGWTLLPPRIKLSAGHTTAGVDAEEIIEAVIRFFEDVIAGNVPVVGTREVRGEVLDTWREKGEGGRFVVRAPRRLREEVRRLRAATL